MPLNAPTAPSILWINEDMLVRIRSLTVAGVLISDAVVTWVILNRGLDLIVDSDGSASPVVGEAGGYKGTIQSEVTGVLTEGETYYVDITITQQQNDGFRRLKCVAKYRGRS